ncbi:hypothetical protein M413DRAFT_431000 [Hebeloma cylindrosporum]|uniref:Uncharacterized protein n=1 Tax=Hebeloma cylindrosporum TaxID=76867 RepID=A0A0C3BVD7_HEBCY|nr:hypothetical protein M413DRAFT_431000 [Hebeloma cylindrosporum h7]
MHTSEHYLFAQFHVINNIPSSIIGNVFDMISPQTYLKTYFQLIQHDNRSWVVDSNEESLFKILADSKFGSRLLPEENTLAILEILDPRRARSPTLSKLSAECELRLLAAVCSEIGPLFPDSPSPKAPSRNYTLSLHWAMQHLKKSGDEIEFVRQLGLCIDLFFSTIINSNLDNPHLEQSFHAHTFFLHYLDAFAWNSFDLDSENLAVVIPIITAISAALTDNPGSTKNFLFYPASYFAKQLAGFYGQPIIVSALPPLLEALRSYKPHLGEGNPSLEKKMGIPSFSAQEWWGFLDLPGAKPACTSRPNSEEIVISIMEDEIEG